MSPLRSLVAFLILGCLPVAALSQEDRPKLFVSKAPPTQKELDRRASLYQYAWGLLCEREDRLLEALKAFEQAAKLDPEAAAVYKAQVPLLLALDRTTDAQITLRKVLELNPADHETWFLSARLHKSLGQYKDARIAIDQGLKSPGMKENPEAAQQMYLDLAGLHEAADELPQALVAYEEAAKILEHPDLILEASNVPRQAILARCALTYEKIGHVLRRQKKYDEAIAAFKKAQARNPEGAGRLNFNLAHLAIELGRGDEALAYLDAYLRLQPLGLEAYDMKLALLKRLNKQDAILPWLEQAVANDKHNGGLKLMLAEQYRLARHFGPAEKLYQELAEDAPSADLYKGLFRLYRENPMAGMAKALTVLNTALESANQKPAAPPGATTRAKSMITALRDDAALATELVQVGFDQLRNNKAGAKELRYETVHLLGVLADKHKKLDEAEAFYRKCLSNPDTATEALVYSGYLRVLYKARKFDEMVKVCERAVDEKDPKRATNPVMFYMELARAQARLGKMTEALRAADQAIDRAGDQDRLAVQHLRIRVLLQAEKFAQAEEECQTLLKEHSGSGEALDLRYLLSSVYSAAKQMAKAEEQLSLILKFDPDNATANNDLGYLWADQGKNLKEAEAMIRRALEEDRRQRKQNPRADDQDNAAYIDSLGWALFRLGKLDEAKKELERAATLPDGEDPVIHDHLGDVYYRLNQPAAAAGAWRKAAQLYETEDLRRRDDRYQEVLRKVKRVEGELKGR